ncbi:methyltransferase domain-containing protein [Marinilabiliaceae bacterium JC017]|nr:methyltransferase domain-containing protein [Marinilabiliaceae bacterium JC017]
MIIQPSKDPLGLACLDYINGIEQGEILVRSNITEDDSIPADYLFRSFDQMPELEQQALKLCKGRTLDVGAGSGTHSLYLQKKGIDVTSLDASPNACRVCQIQGIQNVINEDFFDVNLDDKYDTILMMMNGIGISGTLQGLDQLFAKAKELLAPGGQLLIDSSDIRYMFIDDTNPLIPEPEGPYYGEVTYQMEYKDITCVPFKWLFIDPILLNYRADANGFNFEKMGEGTHYDFLARLTLK